MTIDYPNDADGDALRRVDQALLPQGRLTALRLNNLIHMLTYDGRRAPLLTLSVWQLPSTLSAGAFLQAHSLFKERSLLILRGAKFSNSARGS